MSYQIPGPNRSPPARIHFKSTVESVPISPRPFSLEKKYKEEKKLPSMSLWASVKAKAAVFNVFDRGKPAEAGPPPGSPGQPPSRVPPLPPFQGALDADYDQDDSDEGGKLKDEHGRTLRRSVDSDQRRRHSARITITNEQGEVNNYPYRPRRPTLDEIPSMLLLPFSGFTDSSLIYQSTTALSAVGSQSDARQALLDFPDLENAVERYIRDGTPSVASLNSEEAIPVRPVTDGIIYNIPYDENEVYDQGFDFLGHAFPRADATPRPRARGRSVRFASHDTDINARIAAEHAVETHKRLMNSASLGIISGNGSTLDDAKEEKNSRPKSFLPRQLFTTTAVSQRNASRTPSPTKTIRQQKSHTFFEKSSPSPAGRTSLPSNRKKIPSPIRQPFGHSKTLSFSGSTQSLLRSQRCRASPSKGAASPSKSCLSYESPTKGGYVRWPDMKRNLDDSRPQAPVTPTALTMENTPLKTPTSPAKLTPVHSRTPTSPTKLTSTRPQSPASLSKFCASSMSPFATDTSPFIRAKEAHAFAAAQKAAEVAELKRRNLDMLAQKKFEDEERLKIKKGEIAMKRQVGNSASRCVAILSSAVQCPALSDLTPKKQARQGTLGTLESPRSALQSLRSPALNKSRAPTSKLPVLAKKESKLPVLVKKQSTAGLCRPGFTPIDGRIGNSTSMAVQSVPTETAGDSLPKLAPSDSMQFLRAKPSSIGMAASTRAATQLKPKDSKQSLRERPIQISFGQKARSALPMPKAVLKS